MTLLRVSLAVAAGVLLGVLVTSDPSALLVASVVVLLSVAIIRMSIAAADVPASVRARAHREPLSEIPAPRHPRTPGRSMARAPGAATAT